MIMNPPIVITAIKARARRWSPLNKIAVKRRMRFHLGSARGEREPWATGSARKPKSLRLIRPKQQRNMPTELIREIEPQWNPGYLGDREGGHDRSHR